MFSGDTKSCGCLRREVMRAKATKHGACMPGQRTPEYWIHRRLMDRCMNVEIKGLQSNGTCATIHELPISSQGEINED
jgi:hypothetical protein